MTETLSKTGALKAQLLDNNLSSTVIANRTVANYRLVEIKGTGGMASIYKAIQLSLERPVALKIMHPHLHNNETFVARFEKEAKRAAMLQHENIVSIIDYGCDNGEYFIAMEYIDGTNLGEIFKKQRKMPLEVALHICHQVAEGLKYAHSMGIVHRDVKPANIMLSYDGRVMITDFGIAKATGDLTITSTGQVIGSPSYMAPEQAAGRATDHRSDLFSLGIILFEIIAGEKPFHGDTYQSLITSIMSDYPVSLREFRVDVTPEIDELVQKALVKSIDSRYQTAEEFSEAIFGQISKFKIQTPRKVMAEYLKSPIRVTEKLRADKISDHMESALYFLAVGEGKLAEARREFLDVLRFDKNNKEAKRYLARIESQLPEKKTERSVESGFKKGIIYIAAILAVVFLSISIVSMFPDSDMQIQGPSVEVVQPLNETKPSIVIGSNNQSDNERTSQTLSRPDNDRGLPSFKTGPNGVSSRTDMGAISTPVDQRMIIYDYPQQHLVRYGSIKVTTNVFARLLIDNENYSWTNGPQIKLLPGRHLIEVSSEGFKTAYKRIFLKRGASDTLRIDLVLK